MKKNINELISRANKELLDKITESKIALSITQVGSAITKKNEKVRDIDIVLVIDDYRNYNRILEILRLIKNKYSNDHIEIVTVTGRGPIRALPNKNKLVIQFQVMAFSVKELKDHKKDVCLPRYYWQFEKPLVGRPFSQYFTLKRLTSDDLLYAHTGIIKLLDSISNNYIPYWEGEMKGDKYWIEEKREKIINKVQALEFYYYCVIKTAINYLTLRKRVGKKAFHNPESSLKIFSKAFPDKELSNYPLKVIKEQERLRLGKLRHDSNYVREVKNKAIDFLESLRENL
jgi:hypothetical protein